MREFEITDQRKKINNSEDEDEDENMVLHRAPKKARRSKTLTSLLKLKRCSMTIHASLVRLKRCTLSM